MQTYRLYLVGPDGHFKAWATFDCASDDEAVAEAQIRMGAYPGAELWHWGRLIAVIRTESEAA